LVNSSNGVRKIASQNGKYFMIEGRFNHQLMLRCFS